jgi:hypothetical protein
MVTVRRMVHTHCSADQAICCRQGFDLICVWDDSLPVEMAMDVVNILASQAVCSKTRDVIFPVVWWLCLV